MARVYQRGLVPSSTERLRFQARLIKPFSWRFVRCLWTVAKRRQTEPTADLLEARRIPVLVDELVEKIENLSLSFG